MSWRDGGSRSGAAKSAFGSCACAPPFPRGSPNRRRPWLFAPLFLNAKGHMSLGRSFSARQIMLTGPNPLTLLHPASAAPASMLTPASRPRTISASWVRARESAQKVEQGLCGQGDEPNRLRRQGEQEATGHLDDDPAHRALPDAARARLRCTAMAQMARDFGQSGPAAESDPLRAQQPADDPQLAATQRSLRPQARARAAWQGCSSRSLRPGRCNRPPRPRMTPTRSSRPSSSATSIDQELQGVHPGSPRGPASRRPSARLRRGSIRHLLERYHQQLAQRRAAGQQTSGLSDAALIEYIAGNLAKIMAKAGGAGAATVGVGLHSRRSDA